MARDMEKNSSLKRKQKILIQFNDAISTFQPLKPRADTARSDLQKIHSNWIQNTVIHHCDKNIPVCQDRGGQESGREKNEEMVLNCEWEALWWADLFFYYFVRGVSLTSTIIKFYGLSNFTMLYRFIYSQWVFCNVGWMDGSLNGREGSRNRSALNLHFKWFAEAWNCMLTHLLWLWEAGRGDTCAQVIKTKLDI